MPKQDSAQLLQLREAFTAYSRSQTKANQDIFRTNYLNYIRQITRDLSLPEKDDDITFIQGDSIHHVFSTMATELSPCYTADARNQHFPTAVPFFRGGPEGRGWDGRTAKSGTRPAPAATVDRQNRFRGDGRSPCVAASTPAAKRLRQVRPGTGGDAPRQAPAPGSPMDGRPKMGCFERNDGHSSRGPVP